MILSLGLMLAASAVRPEAPGPVPLRPVPRLPSVPPAPAPPPMSLAEALARRAVQPPLPLQPLISLFSEEDYPAGLERKWGPHRSLNLRLTVTDFGTVRRCEVRPQQFRPDELVTATCTILAFRSQFRPAVDGSGRPTVGTFDVVIDWNAIFQRAARR